MLNFQTALMGLVVMGLEVLEGMRMFFVFHNVRSMKGIFVERNKKKGQSGRPETEVRHSDGQQGGGKRCGQGKIGVTRS